MSENQIGSLLMLVVAIPTLVFWGFCRVQRRDTWDEIQESIGNWAKSLIEKLEEKK